MLSQKAKSLTPSPTLALAAKAKELKAEGKDVVSLTVGEPDWNTYDHIKEAAIKAMNEGFTKYTPSNGIPELRKAIAEQTNTDLGTDFSPEEVTVSTGGKFILFGLLQMICDPGDEVIIPAPFWVSYPTMVELAGGLPRIVTCDSSSNFKITPMLLRESLTEKTKAIILNSPSNPTGNYYTKNELDEIAKLLLDFPNVVIISDDIYNRLVFDKDLAPNILQSEPKLKERTVLVNGLSKTYSMTGWRLGWALGPKQIISAMTKYQSQSVSCAVNFVQHAAVTAIKESAPYIAKSLESLKTRRTLIHEKLNAIGGIEAELPMGAFYIWPNVSSFVGKKYNGNKIENSRDFSNFLLEDQMVVVVPGVDFGLDGYIRMSFAVSESDIGKAASRIEAFTQKLT